MPRPPARESGGGPGSRHLADGDTEVSVLLPRRLYSWGWGHLLHDRTADRLAASWAGSLTPTRQSSRSS